MVAVGIAFLAPVALGAAVAVPEFVIDGWRLAADPAKTTAAQLRQTAILACAVELIAIGLAASFALVHRSRRPKISGESVWFDVLGQVPAGGGIYIDLELLDGRLIRGQLRHFDGTSAGRGRDIAVCAESFTTKTGRIVELPGGVLVVSEQEIRTFTAQVVDRAGRPIELENSPTRRRWRPLHPR